MNTHKATLGLDAAQAGVAYQLNDTNNNALARGKAPASNAGIELLCSELRKRNLTWAEVPVAIEATGQWHLHWCEKLHALGAKVHVLNPLIAKRTSALDNAIRDNKSDPVDAGALAELLAREHHRLARFLYQSPGPLHKLQRLQHARQSMRANLTNLKKSLAAARSHSFPELHALGLCDKRERALLIAAPTPARVLALARSELEKHAAAKAEAIRQAAATSFAEPALSEANASALAHLAQSVDKLEAQLEDIDIAIEQQARETFGLSLLEAAKQLPGFGDKTTVAILGSIPAELLRSDMPRRKKANKIQALCGCDPRVRQSGESKGVKRLSKRGSAQARTALFQAAVCAMMNDAPLQTIYKALRARGKAHKVALFDIARRLIRRLVAILAMHFKTQPQSTQPQPV